MKYLLCILGRKKKEKSLHIIMDGVFDCQTLNYLSLNCTNDIHEDLLDFNM